MIYHLGNTEQAYHFKFIVLLSTESDEESVLRKMIIRTSKNISLVWFYLILLHGQSWCPHSLPLLSFPENKTFLGRSEQQAVGSSENDDFSFNQLLTPYFMVAKTFKFSGKHRIHLHAEFKNMNALFRSVRRNDEWMLVNPFPIPRSKMWNKHYHYCFHWSLNGELLSSGA